VAIDDETQYRTDLSYTHGYYYEQAPGLIDFAVLLSGHRPPDRTGGLTYLELGYGQGVTANIHAAACPGVYHGTDFIPDHALNAQALAGASGADAHFLADSFTDLVGRTDLPQFDYVSLHGVWSWVPEADRQAIVDTLRDRLKPGGAVYFGYNCQPGWASEMPLRELLSLHARRIGGDDGRSPESIAAAIDFARALADSGGRYFTNHPGTIKLLDKISSHDRRYLAHDYFNRVWSPTYFADLATRLNAADLQYAGPARLAQRIDSLQLTPAQRAVIDSIGDPILRETARDYATDRAFRADLFTRRGERISEQEQTERLMATRLVLIVRGDEVPLEIEPALGVVSLDRAIYRPVILALGANGGSPKSIGELLARPEIAALPPGKLLEALVVLTGINHAHPVQTDEQIAIAQPRCEALNQALRERARTSGDIRYLASPVIGAGVRVGRFEQLFLSARRRGLETPADWARDVHATLAANGETAAKNGKPLQLSAEAVPELTKLAKHFAVSRLAVLEQLEVA
jgi:SAM-dependent methyltransferase